MLSEGRLPMNQAEQDAIERLIGKDQQASISITRRDPGESGPLLAHIDSDTYIISDNGTTTKQAAS